VKNRAIKKQVSRSLMQSRKIERRKLDSHMRLDPRMFWIRMTKIDIPIITLTIICRLVWGVDMFEIVAHKGSELRVLETVEHKEVAAFKAEQFRASEKGWVVWYIKKAIEIEYGRAK